jgi:transmembrane sensor
VTADIAQEAVEWIVRLSCDDHAERARAAAGFDAWKAADPRHAAVAARMQGLIARAAALRDAGVKPARAALDAVHALDGKPRRPRRAAAALAVALLLLAPGWLALRAYPPAYLVADLRSSTGQWQSHTLPDGTRVMLGSGSALNLHFDRRRRMVELVRGEMLVEVAADAARPFLVRTAEGSVRALGTRFLVRSEGGSTTLSMLESRTLVHTATQQQTAPGVTISANQRVRFRDNALGAVVAIDGSAIEDAWRHHRLVAYGSPLTDVLDELNRHHPGHIQFDRRQLVGIRVYVVLPLDDTGRALQLLVDSLPQLRVRRLTRYFVMVDMAPAR